jgi:hypothetical protein
MMIWVPHPEPDGVGVALTRVLVADEEMGVTCVALGLNVSGKSRR